MSTARLTPFEALNLAITRAGSQAAMARICEVSQPAVWKWCQTGKRLPGEHVLTVERETGVSRHDLRPDLYPRGLQDDRPFCPPDSFVAVDRPTVARHPREFLQQAGGR